MTPVAPFLIYALLSSSLLSITSAQDRAPHGLAYEKPTALSPSAFEFFHQNTNDHPSMYTQDRCAVSTCSPLMLAAMVASTLAHESKSTAPETGRKRVEAGAIAGIVFGFVFMVLLAMRVYYGVVTRQTNLSRSSCVQLQPDA